MNVSDAARALLKALPRCDAEACEAPATVVGNYGIKLCQEHGFKFDGGMALPTAAPAADLRAALAAEADDPALVAAVVEAAEHYIDEGHGTIASYDAGRPLEKAVDALRAKRAGAR